jgi:hypothetical protein
MTEQVPPQQPEWTDEESPDVVEEAPAEVTRTGVPAVDEVLADVDRLDDTPLDEHLAAFERAHESLRSALDADPGDPA